MVRPLECVVDWLIRCGRSKGKSFLQSDVAKRRQSMSAGDFAVKISTAALPMPDESIKDAIDKIEAKRTNAETQIFEQAISWSITGSISLMAKILLISYKMAFVHHLSSSASVLS